MCSARSQIGWAGKAAPSGAQRLALERPHKLWQPFLSLYLSVVSVYASRRTSTALNGHPEATRGWAVRYTVFTTATGDNNPVIAGEVDPFHAAAPLRACNPYLFPVCRPAL